MQNPVCFAPFFRSRFFVFAFIQDKDKDLKSRNISLLFNGMKVEYTLNEVKMKDE